MKPLLPGAWLGVIGGGQLGRMFVAAALRLGYRTAVLDPDRDSPAGRLADLHIRAPYSDRRALRRLGRRCSAVTTEFENVPAESLSLLARLCRVAPSAAAVAPVQDRAREKRLIASCGLPVAPWAEIRSAADANRSPARLFPGILKLSRLGYDGRGQARVDGPQQAAEAFARFGARPCVLEKRLALEKEISVIAARGAGRVEAFPVAENAHAGGILDTTVVPARVPKPLAARAVKAARKVMSRLGYEGVLCVEFFVHDGGRLAVNEIAPRPHNSGHYTLDACPVSQFEQQVRVLCGLPPAPAPLLSSAAMANLLGDLWEDGGPDWGRVFADPRARLHLYGKSQARPGRKMGHFTVLGPSGAAALAAARRIKSALGKP